MKFRSTYWIASLSLLLSLSLALPYCCHADISELFSHHQDMQLHGMHSQQSNAEQCDCGHVLAKDYQKTNRVANSQIFICFSAVSFQDWVLFPFDADFKSIPLKIQPGILTHSGPSLHLLNSVFLN